MQCPACRYMMDDFDKECPRCQGKGIAPPQSVPQPVQPQANSPQSQPVAPSAPVPTGTPGAATAATQTQNTIYGCVGCAVLLFMLPVGCAMMFGTNTPSTPESSVPYVSSEDSRRISMEAEVQSGINEQLRAKGVNGTCTSVELVKESDNKYTGLAQYSDGTKSGVSVVIDDDGRYIWKVE